MINVFIVDDLDLTHRLIETYLETEAEIKIVGFAKNGHEAIETNFPSTARYRINGRKNARNGWLECYENYYAKI